jgi:hypothetical protein
MYVFIVNIYLCMYVYIYIYVCVYICMCIYVYLQVPTTLLLYQTEAIYINIYTYHDMCDDGGLL